jgi:hypothetical protein
MEKGFKIEKRKQSVFFRIHKYGDIIFETQKYCYDERDDDDLHIANSVQNEIKKRFTDCEYIEIIKEEIIIRRKLKRLHE